MCIRDRVSPDIIVKQPSRKSNEKTDSDKTKRTVRSEADLRGSLDNDSISSDERNLLREEEKKAEDAAKLRNEDYQLAYALDILKGLSALSYGKK